MISSLAIQAQVMQPRLHSHNDYLQDRPLYAALEHGAASIEIDIILVDGEIIVSHDDEVYNMENTIQALYFDPLKKHIKTGTGRVYINQNQPVQLLVDLKTTGMSILDHLHKIVSQYDLLFKKRDYSKRLSPLQLVLSGSVEKAAMLGKKNYPYFFIDGRCSDIRRNYTNLEMPLISMNYEDYFKWSGEGKVKKKEAKKLKRTIDKIHKQGKKVRFWATPDNVEMWNYLFEKGVDYINVDNLKSFNSYMSTR